ncbi:MAG TPA: phage major capsid protein, partial [Dermatophilaceae bacterium]|nr:phage major capsid protein [Dermatophilaceae bacterium]
MSARLKTLLDKRANAWSQAQDIRTRAEADGYNLTTEEDETWQRALDDVEKLSKQIEVEERHARLNAIAPAAESVAPTQRDDVDPEAGEYRQAFNAMLRRGVGRLSADQQSVLERGFGEIDTRALSSVTDAAGGYTVPDEFSNRLVETMKAYGGLLGIVDVLTTASGTDLLWPTNDDTANEGAILDENTQISEQDVAFGQGKLKAYTYTSKLIRVPLQLLQDSAIDIEAFLARRIGERIGRAVAGHIATGAGTTQPVGVADATVGFGVGVTGATGNTTTVTYDSLVDLEHSVDPAYRGSAQYAMNDLTLAAIRKLKDSQNRPLWVPSVAGGVPSTINGRPYTIDNKLPAPAPNAKSILFGDFKTGYIARRVSGAQVLRLSERYADFLQVGFFGFARWDGVIQDAAAVKAYKHS